MCGWVQESACCPVFSSVSTEWRLVHSSEDWSSRVYQPPRSGRQGRMLSPCCCSLSPCTASTRERGPRGVSRTRLLSSRPCPMSNFVLRVFRRHPTPSYRWTVLASGWLHHTACASVCSHLHSFVMCVCLFPQLLLVPEQCPEPLQVPCFVLLPQQYADTPGSTFLFECSTAAGLPPSPVIPHPHP